MKPAPKIVESHVATCCGNFKFTGTYSIETQEALLSHIEKDHKELFLQLQKKGRILARSQNGRGYFDSDKDNGWAKAQELFRHAWTRHALEEVVIKGNGF
jgi:hypothetical protein